MGAPADQTYSKTDEFNQVSNALGNQGYVYQMDSPQQMMLTECNTRREHYKQLREYKELPWKERAEVTFQMLGMLWGFWNLAIVLLIVGAYFRQQIMDLIKSRIISLTATGKK